MGQVCLIVILLAFGGYTQGSRQGGGQRGKLSRAQRFTWKYVLCLLLHLWKLKQAMGIHELSPSWECLWEKKS